MGNIGKPNIKKSYDFIVIGGGSGGLATARKAASKYNVKVALIESSGKLGGTCVNVGCVPKKVFWQAATIADTINDAAEYGFSINKNNDNTIGNKNIPVFNWGLFKEKLDAYIHRLNNIYEKNLKNDNVDYIKGWGSLVNYKFIGDSKKHYVEVKNLDNKGIDVYESDKVLFATGGKPIIPSSIPGATEYGITSDGFFELKKQPKNVTIVGAGYIAVELAGVFNSLGSKTDLFIRNDKVLRKFDDIIQDNITEIYENKGINIHKNIKEPFKKITKNENTNEITIEYIDSNGETKIHKTDLLLWAVGRSPLTENIGLKENGIEVDPKTHLIKVDKFQNTTLNGVYALGDDTGPLELTPVAIAAGRKLADRLFGGENFKDSHLDYSNVPSAIFAHPEAGSIGLSEKAAIEKYGKDDIKVYKSKFNSMYYAMLEHKVPTVYKLIVQGKNEKVVGLHLLGASSSEILQGFGVAVKMGATKADFDSCVAIHPTSAEEIVTLK